MIPINSRKIKWQHELFIFAVILTALPALMLGLKIIDKSETEITHGINLQLTNIADNVSNEINLFFISQLEKQYLLKKSIENENLGVNEKVALIVSSVSSMDEIISMSLIFKENENYSSAIQTHKENLDSLSASDKAELNALVSNSIEVGKSLIESDERFGNPVYLKNLDQWFVYSQLSVVIDGVPEGHLVSLISLTSLRKRLENPKYNQIGSIAIANTEGELIFNRNDSLVSGEIMDDAIRLLNGNSRVTNISKYTKGEKEYVSSIAFAKNVKWVVIAIEDYEHAYLFVSNLNKTMILWMIIGSSIAMLFGFLVTIRIKKPINHLVDKAKQISKGNFDIHVDYKLDDSIGTLGNTMESMSKSLKDSFNEIEKQNIKLEEYSKTLEEKVLDRTKKLKETNNDLQKAYLKVLDLNNEKNEFLGIAAHDLKNPLVAIKGFGEIIKADETLERSELEEFAKTIIESSERMFDIITSLLDINKIEEGRVEVKYELNSANKLVENLVTQNTEAALKKGIKLNFNKLANDITFPSDKTLLSQVLDNFISNGIKFSPANKDVDINIIARNRSIVFEVKDFGPGLSEEDKSKLFQKFSKLSARPTAGEHSTGLGLSISKKIAEMLGGTIEVYSKLGDGASFSLVIPIDS